MMYSDNDGTDQRLRLCGRKTLKDMVSSDSHWDCVEEIQQLTLFPVTAAGQTSDCYGGEQRQQQMVSSDSGSIDQQWVDEEENETDEQLSWYGRKTATDMVSSDSNGTDQWLRWCWEKNCNRLVDGKDQWLCRCGRKKQNRHVQWKGWNRPATEMVWKKESNRHGF